MPHLSPQSGHLIRLSHHLAMQERKTYIPDMSGQDSKRARHSQGQVSIKHALETLPR
jgi:hypothetical protein